MSWRGWGLASPHLLPWSGSFYIYHSLHDCLPVSREVTTTLESHVSCFAVIIPLQVSTYPRFQTSRRENQQSTVRAWGVREESWQKFETVYLDKVRILPSCHLNDGITCRLFYCKQLYIFEHTLLQCSVTGNTVNIPTKKYKSWLLTLKNYVL